MADDASRRPKVATIGAAYSANKGAGSMIQAIVDHLDVAIDVHSTYPIADASALADCDHVEVIAASPRVTAAFDFPLAVVAGALRRVGLPWGWLCRTPVLQSLRDTSVVADITGISFSDDRPVQFAPYHFLLDAVPMLLGVPVVKCSQAIGPFQSMPVRVLAKMILPRLDQVISRGPSTSALLDELGVAHIEAHDLAFVMEMHDDCVADATRLLADRGIDGRFVALAPSTLVRQKSAASGLDYVELLVTVIDEIAAQSDVPIVVMAHSSEPSTPDDHESVPDRLNDLVVCRELAAALGQRDGVVLLDMDLSPVELRAVISRADVLVTSRFHAMISALSLGVAPVVIGWSHKYGEVLAAFELDGAAIDYNAVDASTIAEVIVTQLRDSPTTRATILRHLTSVKESAMTNISSLEAVVSR